MLDEDSPFRSYLSVFALHFTYSYFFSFCTNAYVLSFFRNQEGLALLHMYILSYSNTKLHMETPNLFVIHELRNHLYFSFHLIFTTRIFLRSTDNIEIGVYCLFSSHVSRKEFYISIKFKILHECTCHYQCNTTSIFW